MKQQVAIGADGVGRRVLPSLEAAAIQQVVSLGGREGKRIGVHRPYTDITSREKGLLVHTAICDYLAFSFVLAGFITTPVLIKAKFGCSTFYESCLR